MILKNVTTLFESSGDICVGKKKRAAGYEER